MSTLRALKPAQPLQEQLQDRPGAAPEFLQVARPSLPPVEMVLPYLAGIDERRWYSNWGPLVVEFERRLAARFQPGQGVVTVANATQGLALTLQALELERGALVALPSWTFAATAHAVIQAGLIPFFLDVDPESWSLTPEIVTRALRAAPGRVAAAIVVAPFGRPLDAKLWAEFSQANGLPVVVDAAAAFDGVGEAPLPTVVSLHATKALGVGEGGFLASGDEALLDRVRGLTGFGFRGSREALYAATNAKLSEYAAAVGLAGLDIWPSTRMRYGLVAQSLRIALTSTPEVVFQPGWGLHWVSSVCVARLPEGSADRIERSLHRQGVDTRRWWSHGCHAQPAFADCPRLPLPVTDTLARSTIGLPYAMDMHGRTIGRLAEALARAMSEG